jgi:hypothetical protein
MGKNTKTEATTTHYKTGETISGTIIKQYNNNTITLLKTSSGHKEAYPTNQINTGGTR